MILEKDKKYEILFKQWMDQHGIMHIPFEQSMESYAEAFKSMEAKRPDFLILLKHLGLICVDVKSRTIKRNYQDFFLEENDVYYLSRFQEISCMPTWIAMTPRDLPVQNIWYWINVAEVKRLPKAQNEKFGSGYAVKLEKCIEIKKSEGISQIVRVD